MCRILALIAFLFTVSACSFDPTYLPALLDDPLADYSHPDLRAKSRIQDGKGEGMLGKTIQPKVSTTYVRKRNVEE